MEQAMSDNHTGTETQLLQTITTMRQDHGRLLDRLREMETERQQLISDALKLEGGLQALEQFHVNLVTHEDRVADTRAGDGAAVALGTRQVCSPSLSSWR